MANILRGVGSIVNSKDEVFEWDVRDAQPGQGLIYQGGKWIPSDVFNPNVRAEGGIITEFEDAGQAWRVHTFTNGTQTFSLQDNTEVDYLIVAGGGGGGGGRHGGGGGGGGLLTGTISLTPNNYSIVVGEGGARGTTSGHAGAATYGGKGQDSTCFGLTAIGGGAGAAHPVSGYSGGCPGEKGGDGGSGGGSAHTATSCYGSGTDGQGHDGNACADRAQCGAGGGAGGPATGGSGSESTSTGVGRHGGPGSLSNIDGNNFYYAGGGGGSGSPHTSFLGAWRGGSGGIGGGGGGGCSSNAGFGGAGGGSARNPGVIGIRTQTTGACHGGDGGTNTGGGGGGAAGWSDTGNGNGGKGGSGVVILRYKIPKLSNSVDLSPFGNIASTSMAHSTFGWLGTGSDKINSLGHAAMSSVDSSSHSRFGGHDGHQGAPSDYPSYCAIYLGANNAKPVNKLSICVHANSFGYFEFQGSNDAGTSGAFYNTGTWTSLPFEATGSSRTKQNAGGAGSGLSEATVLTFLYNNNTPYTHYRILCKDNSRQNETMGQRTSGWATYYWKLERV